MLDIQFRIRLELLQGIQVVNASNLDDRDTRDSAGLSVQGTAAVTAEIACHRCSALGLQRICLWRSVNDLYTIFWQNKVCAV